MILQALVNLYDSLAEDPNADIAPYGFTDAKVSWCVVVNDDGELVALEDVQVPVVVGKKEKYLPRIERVPDDCGKRTVNPVPNLLCDSIAYIFGFDPDNKDDIKKAAKDSERFRLSKEHYLALEKQIGDPSFSAVCRFFEKWDATSAESHPVLASHWSELAKTTGMFIFRRDGDLSFVHAISAVKKAWAKIKTESVSSDDVSGQCLVTGDSGVLEPVHASVKGVQGAQSSGAAVVSFNASAFVSYGKTQSLNAPVGKLAAFKYTTALNWLLSGRKQCVQIGDASTVYWCGAKETPFLSLFGEVMGVRKESQDESQLGDVKSRMMLLNGKGAMPQELGEVKSPFYVLGLAPNAARLSVRFWYVSTLGETFDHLKAHYDALRIERQFGDDSKHPEPEYPAPWQLLRETARESKDIPPILNGELMRAILTGGKYPESLYASVLRRIAADRTINYLRASIIKTILTRNHSNQLNSSISMSLDTTCKDPAYLLGRLFAALEKAQSDSAEVKATIKDRFFSSASATPSMVFPRLIQLNQHHLRKLKGEKPGMAVNDEKLIGSIMEDIKKFPSRQGLKDQGQFVIGYYHQRNDFFKKKDKPEESAA